MAGAEELERAECHLARWQFRQAAEACRAALATDPANSEAEHLLGRIMCEAGQVGFAALMLQRVAVLRPDDATVWVSLGRAQRMAGELPEAVASLGRALELDPELLSAFVEIAEAHLQEREPDSALEVLSAALQRHPETGMAHFALAGALLDAGRVLDARAAFSRAVELDGAMGVRHERLAAWHRGLGRHDEARRMLEAGLALQPGSPELEHLLAAARGVEAGTRAEDAYIVSLFDRFASGFDERLSELQYRTPYQLMELLTPLLGEDPGSLDILDAGCGTGLSAPLWRDRARRLVGVDLSPGMLARAAELQLYDELHEAELAGYLASVPEAFDLIVCADVLVYFGDVSELFAAMAGALRPGGLLGVSAELHAGDGRELRSTGRWAHGHDELARAAEAAGLRLELTEHPLRLENERMVTGLYGVGSRVTPPHHS
jgi:predicted TPR repeat methyltransferase